MDMSQPSDPSKISIAINLTKATSDGVSNGLVAKISSVVEAIISAHHSPSLPPEIVNKNPSKVRVLFCSYRA